MGHIKAVLSKQLLVLCCTVSLLCSNSAAIADTPPSTSSTGAGVSSAAGTPSSPAVDGGLVVSNGLTLLTGSQTSNLSNLTVSQGSTLVIDFGTLNGLNLTGNLSNNGTIYAISSNQAVNTATFNAQNIFNNGGGLLTTILPQGGLAGLSLSGLVANLSLTLNAIQNIVNAGTISSAGNLTAVAGGSIINSMQANLASAMIPVMQAMNNLNLQAANMTNAGLLSSQLGTINALTSSLTNSGSMQALVGNINVQNLLGTSLAVNNLLGSMQSLSAINFQTLATNNLEKATLNLNGGALEAQTINFISPDGIIHVSGDTISGIINISGGEALVGVNSGSLSVASLILTGDPVIYNTTGDVIIDLSMFSAALSIPGEDWTFLAGGNILAGAGTFGQTFSTGTGANGKLTLAAGVTFTPTGGVGTVTVPGAAVPFVINAAPSATGGNIDLPGINLLTDGRDVSLLARGVLLGNPGTIEIGNITSSGLGAQPAGVISIVASDTINTGALISIGGTGFAGGLISVASSQTISLDSIISAGGAGAPGLNGGLGGAISLAGPGNSTVTGTITSRGGNGGAATLAGGAGGAGGIGGDISLVFGGDIGGQQILSQGGDGGAGGDGGPGIPGGSGGGGGIGGNISLAAGGEITTLATLSLGGNGGAGGLGDPGGSGGLAGTGGDISMVSVGNMLPDTVISFGGLGGIGGIGSTPIAGGQGGIGGGGGTGGNISLRSISQNIDVCQVVSFGGSGGAGATGFSGAAGGNGGAGGLGGVGGNISLTATFGTSVAEQLVSLGGDGGLGAIGNAVAAGGNGGIGGGGGTGGNVSVTAGISSTTDEVVSLGGAGGIGGIGLAGADGGAGGAGGLGGTAGNLSVTTTFFDIVGNNFFSTAGIGGAGADGHSGAAGGTGGIGGGGGVGGNIGLTAGRDAIVCCVQSTGAIGGVGGSGQALAAGGSGGAAGGGGRGGDLSVTVGRDSLVDKLITIGGDGGAGGTGDIGDPGGAGGLGARAGDISIIAGATIYRDIISTTGGLGGASGFGTPPGLPGGVGIDGAISLTTPNPIIDFVAPDCVNCLQLSAAGIQATFRQQIMDALAANTQISCDSTMILTQLCPPGPSPTPSPSPSPTAIQTLAVQPIELELSNFAADGSTVLKAQTNFVWTVTDQPPSYLQKIDGTNASRAMNGHIALSSGQIFVEGGENGEVVDMAIGNVEIPAGGAAIIRTGGELPTTITSLHDGDTQPIIVHTATRPYSVSVGEQLIVEAPVAGSNVINKDQLARRYGGTFVTNGADMPNTSAAELASRDELLAPQIMKVAVFLPEMVEKYMILHSTTHHFRNWLTLPDKPSVFVATVPGGIISSTPQSTKGTSSIAKAPSSGENSNPDDSNPSQWMPIAFHSGMSSAALRSSSNTNMTEKQANVYDLKGGSVLFYENAPVKIDTPQGSIYIEQGAAALVTVRNNMTLVRNCFDKAKGSVRLDTGSAVYELKLGTEACIVPGPKSFARRLLWQDNMARRDIVMTQLPNNNYLVTSAFSMIYALNNHGLLQGLKSMPDAKYHSLHNKMVKTAAVLSTVVDRTRGPYVTPMSVSRLAVVDTGEIQ